MTHSQICCKLSFEIAIRWCSTLPIQFVVWIFISSSIIFRIHSNSADNNVNNNYNDNSNNNDDNNNNNNNNINYKNNNNEYSNNDNNNSNDNYNNNNSDSNRNNNINNDDTKNNNNNNVAFTPDICENGLGLVKAIVHWVQMLLATLVVS